MFCQKCGNKLEKGEMFCSECGTKVQEKTENPTDLPDDKGKENKNKKILIFLSIFIIGLLVFIFLNGRLENQIEESEIEESQEKKIEKKEKKSKY